MKILHMADTHLGYSAYRKLTNDGTNQREIDIYDSFTQCIDYAIKSNPDLIIHAGDLFDSVRPTNRAITAALHQIIRLSKENIPFVVISGNHETPRLKETGSIFRIFEHLDNVFPIYNTTDITIPFNIKGKKLIIHAVPHCQTKEKFIENLRTRQGQAIKNHKGTKFTSSLELLGADIDTVRQHLESQFKEGMSWDNRGEWHIDHVIPCCKFDLTDIEEQKKCFHYTNLQPLWAKENLQKGGS